MNAQTLADRVFGSVKDYIARAINARVCALEQRISDMEARLRSMPAIEYVGVHQDGKTYERGQLVTRGGSLWSCMTKTTRARPGTSTDWQLCVKAGRDGRDARAA